MGMALDALAVALGPEVIGWESVPSANAVFGLEYYEPETSQSTRSGQLLMLTAASQMRRTHLAEVIDAAFSSGAAGVVTKGFEPAGALASSRVPWLSLSRDMSWREFDALASRVLGEHDPGVHLEPVTGERLYSLANSIAAVFAGSVAIEDHRRNLLAYSAIPGQAIDELRADGILYRRPPDHPSNDPRYRAVYAADGVVEFPAIGDEAPRAAVAIRAGNVALGSIWAIDPDPPAVGEFIDPKKAAALAQGATLASGYLIDAWRADVSTTRPREAALSRILAGTDVSNVPLTLGLISDTLVSVVVLGAEAQALTPMVLKELQFAVQRRNGVYFPGAVTATAAGHVVSVVPSDQPQQLRHVLETLLPELERIAGQPVVIGVGDLHPIGGDLVAQHKAALDVFACGLELGLPIAHVADVRAQLALRACRAGLSDAGALDDPRLTKFISDHGGRGREMLQTLLVWFEEGTNTARTSSRLSVHEQTVRYRLRRFTELMPGYLDSPDDRLALWIRLRTLGTDHISRAGRDN